MIRVQGKTFSQLKPRGLWLRGHRMSGIQDWVTITIGRFNMHGLQQLCKLT